MCLTPAHTVYIKVTPAGGLGQVVVRTYRARKCNVLLVQARLTDDEVNELAVMAMAGVAAEAQTFDEVLGQGADLIDLQKILNRSESKLSNLEQQNMTRWAVWQATILLRKYEAEWAALKNAMATGQTIATCIKAIESGKYYRT